MEADLIKAIEKTYLAMPKKRRLQLVRSQLKGAQGKFMRKYFPKLVNEVERQRPA